MSARRLLLPLGLLVCLAVSVWFTRFLFTAQENNGVGYKELDVVGAPPAYTEVTRRDSGPQAVASNDTADVLLTEGTGTPGALTLAAATTVIVGRLR